MPDRHGRDPAERRPPRRRFDRGRRNAAGRGHAGAAALARDGQPRQGHAGRLATPRSPRSRCTRTATCPTALTTSNEQPARGTRDFLPDDVRRREYVIGVVRGRLRALRVRAARDAGVREHRDAARQVRRRGQQADLQDPARGEHEAQRRGGPGAALRPHRSARARRRAVSERAAEVLQALPDSAGLARGPARARALPRVLPVRRRRDRLDVAGRRGRAARRR